jgi:hypothetical protein
LDTTMKGRLLAGCLIVLLLGTRAQSQFKASDFQKLKWLEGCWKGTAAGKPFYEGWRFVNDSMAVNFSIEIKDGDTLIEESSPLVLSNGLISLGSGAVQWKASRLMPNEIVLNNDTLKYSNTILWLHTKEDHWFTILQHPRSTVYYDMTRDEALDKKLSAWFSDRRKIKKN